MTFDADGHLQEATDEAIVVLPDEVPAPAGMGEGMKIPITAVIPRLRARKQQTDEEARARKQAYDRRRYLENRETITARNAAYDAAHPDQVRARCRTYRRSKSP
jgi:hypothetical protein